MYPNHNHRPDLVSAVLAGDVQRVEHLLNLNHDPNTQFCRSPIVDFAARSGNLAITKLLVDRGAQVSSDAFRFITHQPLIEYLKSRMSITDQFKLAVNQGEWEDVMNLGLQGVNVDTSVDNQGNGLSHILLKIGTVFDLKNILNVLRLDMNIKNSSNQTPLDVAFQGEFLKNESSQNPAITPLVEPTRQLMRVNTDKEFFVKNDLLSGIYERLTSQQGDVFKTLIDCNADPSQASQNTQTALKSLGLLANSSEHDNQSAIHNLEINEVELTGDPAVDDSVM
jgi:hypothetical protein